MIHQSLPERLTFFRILTGAENPVVDCKRHSDCNGGCEGITPAAVFLNHAYDIAVDLIDSRGVERLKVDHGGFLGIMSHCLADR